MITIFPAKQSLVHLHGYIAKFEYRRNIGRPIVGALRRADLELIYALVCIITSDYDHYEYIYNLHSLTVKRIKPAMDL